jgi:hypothetical protein
LNCKKLTPSDCFSRCFASSSLSSLSCCSYPPLSQFHAHNLKYTHTKTKGRKKKQKNKETRKTSNKDTKQKIERTTKEEGKPTNEELPIKEEIMSREIYERNVEGRKSRR